MNDILRALKHISYSTLYPTSCDLGTAVEAGLGPSLQHRLAVGPLALSHHNPTVCSLPCCWRLRLALLANKSLFRLKPTLYA